MNIHNRLREVHAEINAADELRDRLQDEEDKIEDRIERDYPFVVFLDRMRYRLDLGLSEELRQVVVSTIVFALIYVFGNGVAISAVFVPVAVWLLWQGFSRATYIIAALWAVLFKDKKEKQ